MTQPAAEGAALLVVVVAAVDLLVHRVDDRGEHLGRGRVRVRVRVRAGVRVRVRLRGRDRCMHACRGVCTRVRRGARVRVHVYVSAGACLRVDIPVGSFASPR